MSFYWCFVSLCNFYLVFSTLSLLLVRKPRLLFSAVAMASPSRAAESGGIPTLPERIQSALSAHKRGEVDQALLAYESILPDVQGIPKIESTLHNNAAAIYVTKGEYEIAKQHFLAAITAEPNDPQAHFNLAIVLSSKLRQHGLAIGHCGKAIKLDSNHYKAHHLMGNILQDLGKEADAQRYFVLAANLAREQNAPYDEGDSKKVGQNHDDEKQRNDDAGSMTEKWKEFPIMFAKLNDQFSYDLALNDHNNGNEIGSTGDVGFMTVLLTCISEQPRIFRATNLMTSKECEHIQTRASEQLERSYVMGGASASEPAATATATAAAIASNTEEVTANGESNTITRDNNSGPTNAYRSSHQAWLHADEVAVALQKRLATITGLPYRLFQQKSEELQVVKYDGGGQFKVHHDSSMFHQRLLTALLYLNDVPKANQGGTWFPFANPPGSQKHDQSSHPTTIEEAIAMSLQFQPADDDVKATSFDGLPGLIVTPKRGDAIIFFNHLLSGELDPLAVHAGLPVLAPDSHSLHNRQGEDPNQHQEPGTVKEGEAAHVQKWIANYWVELNEQALFGVDE